MIRMDISPIDPALKKAAALHWAWVILAISFANLFVNYSVRLGYGVVLPEMIQNLGLTRTAGGSIYNAYLFAYILLTPLTGLLTDRFGARPVISACGVILSLGVLLMGTTGDSVDGLPFLCSRGSRRHRHVDTRHHRSPTLV